MRRLFAEPDTVSGDRIYITDKNDVAYIRVVLRMKTGDNLLVLNGDGKSYEARIEEIAKDNVILSIVSERPAEKEVKTRITLYQGLPKGAKMDEIVRKSTELGANRIVPVLTARSVPEHRSGIPAAKLDRWRRIAEEAARQSRRVRVPEVTDVLTLDAVVGGLQAASYDLALLLFELEEARTLKYALREDMRRLMEIRDARGLQLALFVGPEGGFEQTEADRLVREGAVSVTVGETILRTETAGPAAVAMIRYEFEL